MYNILISTDCLTHVLQGEIELAGTTDINPYEGQDVHKYETADIKNISDEEFTTLLGHKIPDSKFVRDKKGRIIVTPNTTMRDLVNAPGSTGRFFCKEVPFAIRLIRLF